MNTCRVRVEKFVNFLYKVVMNVNCSIDRNLRLYACESLHELEAFYPGLLVPFLGDDWRPYHISNYDMNSNNGNIN